MSLFKFISKRYTVFLPALLMIFMMTSCNPKYAEALASIDNSNQQQKGDSPDPDKEAAIFGNIALMFVISINELGEKTTDNIDEMMTAAQEKASNNFQIRTGLEYIMKGYKSSAGNSTARIHMNYIELPLYAVYEHPLSSGAVYGGLGPYFAYGIGGKIKGGNFTTNSFGEANGGYKRFDAGLGLTAGYRMSNGFTANLTYEYGLVNVAYASQDINAKNRVLSLNIGYDIARLFRSK